MRFAFQCGDLWIIRGKHNRRGCLVMQSTTAALGKFKEGTVIDVIMEAANSRGLKVCFMDEITFTMQYNDIYLKVEDERCLTINVLW